MARKFNHAIFHGDGHKSQMLYDVVVERLEEAHSNLCGLQQGIAITSPEYKAGMNDIQECIKDIAASLGFEVILKPIVETKNNKNEVSLNWSTYNEQVNKLIEEKYRNVPFGVKPKKLRPKNEETSSKKKRSFFEHDEDEEV